MTAESAAAFWTRVAQDGEFRTKLAAAASDQELEQLIRDAGFVLTAEELQIGIEKWKSAAVDGRQLSDAELEAIAGGSSGDLRGSFSFLQMPAGHSMNLTPVFKG